MTSFLRPLLELDGFEQLDALVFENFNFSSSVALSIVNVSINRRVVSVCLNDLLFDCVAAFIEVWTNNFCFNRFSCPVNDYLFPRRTESISTLKSSVVKHTIFVKLLYMRNSC